MKTVNIAIINKDSEENATIERAFKDHLPLYKIISIITTNENIEEKIKIEKPDIVFLDYSFENIQVKNIIPYLIENDIHIILLIKTNSDAIHAFKIKTLCSIIKPLTHEKIAVAINKIYKKSIQQYYF